MTWLKNVRNYNEETRTNIKNDFPYPRPFIVRWDDDGWGPRGGSGWLNVGMGHLLRGNGRGAGGLQSRVETSSGSARRRRAWSAFIREMILSDVNIVQGPRENGRSVTYIVVEHRLSGARGRRLAFGPSNFGRGRGRLRFVVNFHNRLSSEIKDEICSKLASALRALKSRISRICGINELERRTQSH